MAVLIGTLLAYFMTTESSSAPFAITGHVDTGLPQITLPPTTITTIHNETLNFGEMLESVGAGFVAISLIGIIEIVAVSKAFGKLY